MQNLFNSYSGPRVGLSVDPQWKYVRSGLQRNIAKTIEYYQNKNFTVKSNHLLCRLLMSAEVSIHGDIDSFYNQQQARAVRLTTTFGITSSLNRGIVFKGTFFGEGSKEIIIAHDDYANPQELEANWKDIRAVQFLDHPKSDTSLLLANGRAYSGEEGYSVIAINVPSLFVQYRSWLKEQKSLFDMGEPTLSTSFFVHQYVLTNLLYSQLDIAVFNRLNNFFLGAPLGVPNYRHAFELIDYNSKLDKILTATVHKLATHERDFYTLMREVPLVTAENLLKLSELPQNAPTRQIVWAEIIARLKMVSFLFGINPSKGKKLSGMQINYLKKVYDLFESSKALEAVPDRGLVKDIDAELIHIKTMLKI